MVAKWLILEQKHYDMGYSSIIIGWVCIMDTYIFADSVTHYKKTKLEIIIICVPVRFHASNNHWNWLTWEASLLAIRENHNEESYFD